MLQSDGRDKSEFVVVKFFDPLDAVKLFAGPDFTVPVFEPARHYEVLSRTV